MWPTIGTANINRLSLQGDDDECELFVQEVRRFYPFFPFVGGHVHQAFAWRDYHFPEQRWVLLDLYGTNHDPRIWQDPQVLRPERFRHWNRSAFNFIPQEAGDFGTNHRCAGEWITIAIMKRAVRLLTSNMQYQVPAQDFAISITRLRAIPNSRFMTHDVRRSQPAAQPRD